MAHEHIQKASNFPTNLVKALRGAKEPFRRDLHGYSCDEARTLMKNGFAEPLPVAVAYTFVIGRGRHSLRKYQAELVKACREGLSEIGFKEDRHCSKSPGEFKVIIDKDHGLQLVKVFARGLSPSTALEAEDEPHEAEEADAKEAAEAALEAVLLDLEPNRLEHLTLLGLVELLHDLLPFLCAGLEGRQKARSGEVASPLQYLSEGHLEELRGQWRQGLEQMRMQLQKGGSICFDTRSACDALLQEMQRLPKAGPCCAELRDMLSGLATRSSGDGLKELRKKLQVHEAKLKEAEELHRKWEQGRHRFSSVAEQRSFEASRQKLLQHVAEISQQLHTHLRVRSLGL